MARNIADELNQLPKTEVIRILGFDLPAKDVKPGCDVLIECRVSVGLSGFKLEGYLHWDRHEKKTTSRSSRWRFIRLSDRCCWTSHRGANSLQSSGGLSDDELKVFNSVRDKVKKALLQRREELEDADTLIDKEAESRWQDWISQLDKRKSRALIQMREQIEEERMNRAPCAAEWEPGKRFRRDQPPREVPAKRGCNQFQAYLSNLARGSVPKRRRLTAETAREDSDTEVETSQNTADRPPAVSLLLRDKAVAAAEVEKAGTLWQTLTQMDMGSTDISFTAEQLIQLWRVATAKVALEDQDSQLVHHCILLAELQLSHGRANLSWIHLISVLQAVNPLNNSHATDYLTVFARWLVRVAIPRVFGKNEGTLLDLQPLVEDVGRAYRVLQGSGIAVAGGFGCFAAKRYGIKAASQIPSFFKPEEQLRAPVVAMLLGATLVEQGPDVLKEVRVLLQPGAAPLVMQFDIRALLSLEDEIDEVPLLPEDIRSNREECLSFMNAWQHLLRKRGSQQALTRPFVPVEMLKPLRGDQALPPVLTCYRLEAGLLLSRGSLEDSRVQPYVEAVESGMVHMHKELQKQRNTEQFSASQDQLLQAVASCAALVFVHGTDEQKRQAARVFKVAARIPTAGQWPQVPEKAEPKFGTFQRDNFSELSGQPFSKLLNEPQLRDKAKWMILARATSRPNTEVARFARWALRSAFSGQSASLLRLETAPTSSKPLRNGTTVAEELRRMFVHADTICKDLLQPLLQLLTLQKTPVWLRALSIFAALQTGLLGLVTDTVEASSTLLQTLSSTMTLQHSLNQGLMLAAEVSDMRLRNWIFACFARDLHILLMWMDVSRVVQEAAAAAHIQSLWSVAALAARHLQGGWPPLPQCPKDCRITFNPFLSRSLPGCSEGLGKAWLPRPFSAAMWPQETQGKVPATFAELAKVLQADSSLEHSEQDLGSLAEALSGSDHFDWVRLRRWRIDILSASGILERRRLLAAIYSRLPAIHCTVTQRRHSRGDLLVADQMIKEVLTDATGFLQEAMEEYRAQAAVATGEEDALPQIPQDAKLWSSRFLLYMCRALQLLWELGRSNEHLESGLNMLETFLIHMGCIGQDPDIGRKLMKSTKKALCRAAESIAGTTTSGRTVAGAMWEELAPPTTSPDGCFRSQLGTVYEHTWKSVYTAIAETVH